MAQKCVHKGCGKLFTDPDEPCVYHPGPPEFHEGQKGWKCCKPRVLTFDEFLTIPPCTTGKHSTVDDTPAPEPAPTIEAGNLPAPVAVPRLPIPQTTQDRSASASPAPPPESESDDPSLSIQPGQTCRRKGCNETFDPNGNRDDETCTHHPGIPIFHEGSKGYTCCKRRVLEFDEFMRIEGCKTKKRHLFVGSGKKAKAEEKLTSVRHDFYQTPSAVIASLFLKKIDKDKSSVKFVSDKEVQLDLKTIDGKHYAETIPLYGTIVPEESEFKVMGTKLELTLAKKDGLGWPVLRADDQLTGEIIQSGRAGRA
ncbi:diploid state maintenance protein chpA [Rhizodiscina lignyota]|uniref:Diploid state maintenance protein chpA n=1 Tax=Rhizodiscina lignyota TaxID=1504668 RepID=A0A9P4I3G6_9PEZI|nr:diploid state maintenance protein chpA [Rhizodiscina lignyota]